MTHAEESRLMSGINTLLQEYARSVAIHTDWSEYQEHQAFTAVEDEFLEYRRAVKLDICDGDHDKGTEALQLAVVALKAHIFHTSNPERTAIMFNSPATTYHTYRDGGE